MRLCVCSTEGFSRLLPFAVAVCTCTQAAGTEAPLRKGANVASLMHLFEDRHSAGTLQSHEKLRVRLRCLFVAPVYCPCLLCLFTVSVAPLLSVA